ncbi:MAG: peroxiredoxin [Pseudomonadota bacterium]|nr:peroxiredoxin [Pseudomonadota bacterium]
MTIKVGDRIPSTTLEYMSADGPVKISSDELFAGKRVAAFAVPGAFTPTCSQEHLPGYVRRADDIKAKGVDLIVCLSVNDVFVMDAWGKDQNAGDKVMMVADGGADFARAVGIVVSYLGFGERSDRYSMVVEDGVVKTLHIEVEDAFEVSDADTMLGEL